MCFHKKMAKKPFANELTKQISVLRFDKTNYWWLPFRSLLTPFIRSLCMFLSEKITATEFPVAEIDHIYLLTDYEIFPSTVCGIYLAYDHKYTHPWHLCSFWLSCQNKKGKNQQRERNKMFTANIPKLQPLQGKSHEQYKRITFKHTNGVFSAIISNLGN